MSREVFNTGGHVKSMPLEEDATGAWMSNEGKVAAFLPWFTDDHVAEAPLKHIIKFINARTEFASSAICSRALLRKGRPQSNGWDP